MKKIFILSFVLVLFFSSFSQHKTLTEKKDTTKVEIYIQEILDWLEHQDEVWIYVIISFFAFVENIFPPSPSDVIVVFGGFLSGTGKISNWALIFFTTIGSTIGFVLAYYIGFKSASRKFSNFKKKFISPASMRKVDSWFTKYGYALIVINRFLPGTRAVVSFFAGMMKLDLRKTTALCFISAFFWNLFLIDLGKSLGKNWKIALDYISTFNNVMWIVIVFVVILVFLFILLKRHKSKRLKKNV